MTLKLKYRDTYNTDMINSWEEGKTNKNDWTSAKSKLSYRNTVYALMNKLDLLIRTQSTLLTI